MRLPRRLRLAALALAAGASLASCSLFEKTQAELLTDVPQMALYATAFNASQARYKLHVTYDENVAETLARRDAVPALAIGRYLKNASSRASFQALDQLFSELVINQSAFYGDLLELGSSEGRQILLPVSFNLPLIVFDRRRDTAMADSFVIEMDELEKKGAAINVKAKAGFSAMGFGPRWSPEFLFSASTLLGADFKEGDPLRWNQDGLSSSLAALRAWSERANGSPLAEEEFQFKYLYLPPYKSVEEGRIGFGAMNSSTFFSIAEERRTALAFRWLARDSRIPVDEDAIYAGICRRGEGRQAAEAFLTWFFSEETQKAILEDARRYRSMESSFGIAGGFSSIKAVNEKLFPLYYPSLLGKLPPANYIKAPNIMPARWEEMKRDIVLPFLLEATGPTPPGDIAAALEERIRAWLKKRESE